MKITLKTGEDPKKEDDVNDMTITALFQLLDMEGLLFLGGGHEIFRFIGTSIQEILFVFQYDEDTMIMINHS